MLMYSVGVDTVGCVGQFMVPVFTLNESAGALH